MDKIERALSRLSAGDRFNGEVWYKDGQAWGTTDGQVLVAREATVDDIVAAFDRGTVEAGRYATCLPSTREAARVCKLGGLVGTCVEISRETQPDAERRAQWVAEEEVHIASLQASLARTERSVPQRGYVMEWRAECAQLRTSVRRAQSQLRSLDSTSAHSVRAGASWFDLRLIRRALRALGTTRGRLEGNTFTLSAGVIHTDNGTVIIMPLRS